jgi:hypothetical protein
VVRSHFCRDKERKLRPNDPVLWFRLLASHFINGFGFHILVHALPIQVASQPSLTGVVFRALGMLYLVDLDDAPGTKLTIEEGSLGDLKGKVTPSVESHGISQSTTDHEEPEMSDTQSVIEETRRQLQAIEQQLATLEQRNQANQVINIKTVASPHSNPYEIAMVTAPANNENYGMRSIPMGSNSANNR